MSFTITTKERFWLIVNQLEIAASIAASPESPDVLPPREARHVVDAAKQLRDAATALMENHGDDDALANSVATALRAVGAIAVHDPLNDGRRRLHKRTIVREGAAAAGHQSGLSRKRTAETWQMPALEIARRLRREKPSMGLEDLAYAVSIEMPPKPSRAHDTVRRFLASEENAGRLPLKAKKKS
jgi:hypothetical protein